MPKIADRRNLIAVFLLCAAFLPARAWIYDPSKPLIYEMRIAFETDKWINMYSTATVLSKSDNTVAFRVVANSTVTPTYQLVVTTQGYVGISTAFPGSLLDVNGTAQLRGSAGGTGLSVNSAGNVGIGTAGNDGYALDVAGKAHSSLGFLTANNQQIGWRDSANAANNDWLLTGSNVLQYRSGGTPLFSIAESGSVSVGTTSFGGWGSGAPGPFLNVYSGAGTVETYMVSGQTASGSYLGTYGAAAAASSASEKRLGFVVMQLEQSAETNVYGNMQFYTNNGGGMIERMRITAAGNVGIGAPTPGAYKLNVAGAIYTSGGCTGCSDARWKKNIAPIPSPLEKVSALAGEQFNWRVKEYPDMFFREGTDYGLIAQEVEKTLPELVYEDNGYKFIRYDRLPPLLIEAVKELKGRLEEVKAANQKLEAENLLLEKRLSAVEEKTK